MSFLGEQTVKNIAKPVGAYQGSDGAEGNRRRRTKRNERGAAFGAANPFLSVQLQFSS